MQKSYFVPPVANNHIYEQLGRTSLGDAAKIKTKRVRKHKDDRQD